MSEDTENSPSQVPQPIQLYFIDSTQKHACMLSCLKLILIQEQHFFLYH